MDGRTPLCPAHFSSNFLLTQTLVFYYLSTNKQYKATIPPCEKMMFSCMRLWEDSNWWNRTTIRTNCSLCVCFAIICATTIQEKHVEQRSCKDRVRVRERASNIAEFTSMGLKDTLYIATIQCICMSYPITTAACPFAATDCEPPGVD